MKKLLSIMLTAVLVVSVLVVPAGAFVPAREVTYNPAIVYIDTAQESSTDFDAAIPDKGLNNPLSSGYVVGPTIGLASTTRLPEGNLSYTLELDVKMNQDFTNADSGYQGYWLSSRGSNYALTFSLYGMKADTVRKFKITVDEAVAENNFATVQFMDPGDTEWTTVQTTGQYIYSKLGRNYHQNVQRVGSANTHPSVAFAYSTDWDFTLGAKLFEGDAANTTAEGSLMVAFENVKLTTNASVEVGSEYAVKEGLIYTNDFENGFTAGSGSELLVATGTDDASGKHIQLTHNATAGTSSGRGAYVGVNFLVPNSVITFDARHDAGSVPFSVFGGDGAGKLFNVSVIGKDSNWYTYRIEIGDCSTAALSGDMIKVYKKARGTNEDFVLLTKSLAAGNNVYSPGADVDYIYNVTANGVTSSKNGFAYLNIQINSPEADEKATKWSIDNFQIRNNIAYSGSYSKSAANLTFDSNDATKTVILASYDGEVLKEVDFAKANTKTVKANLSVTAGESATKLYVWSKLEGGKPILASPIEIAQ